MRGNKNSYNVVRSMYGGWVVRKFGSHRAMRRFDTQQQAIDWGKAVSEKREADFVIHRGDGTVQERIPFARGDTSLPDPRPATP